MNECRNCYQPIPSSRKLCDLCEADMHEIQQEAEDRERVFRERQQRVCTTE